MRTAKALTFGNRGGVFGLNGHVVEILGEKDGPRKLGPFDTFDAAKKCAAAWNAVFAAEDEEILIETNEGTYGAAECLAAVGTGDHAFGDYAVWERVGGGIRRVGASAERAPGRARYPGLKAMREKRSQFRALVSTALAATPWA